MEHEYSVINECLCVLKQSNLPTLNKLRLEIQLYQVKTLLLKDAISKELKCGTCGEGVFEGLLCQMRRICDGSSEVDALADLTEHIRGVLTVLGSDQPSH
jgi:hypothetical protein